MGSPYGTIVFRPSLPPNHSKTTRILPDWVAAAARLAWLKTYGTGPMAPKRPNPRPPAPIFIISRRETPQPLSRFLVVMVVHLSAVPAGTSTRPGPWRFGSLRRRQLRRLMADQGYRCWRSRSMAMNRRSFGFGKFCVRPEG